MMKEQPRDISPLTELARILYGRTTYEYAYDPLSGYRCIERKLPGREWHRREQDRGPLHPAVIAAFKLAAPLNWHEVVLQWPHVSESDKTRLAYTQDEKKGIANRQTVTSIGKYLAKHWKNIPDHIIRGIAARYSATGVEIHGTAEKIVEACTLGPASCMQWDEDDIRCYGKGHHPYEVYSPEYGWSIAIRMEAGDIVSRALLLENGGDKGFVRTYMKAGATYSQRDIEMEEHLKAQGYSHWTEWPNGARLKKISTGRGDAGYLLPYIDGGTRSVCEYRDHFVITDDGPDFECDNTDGTGQALEKYSCDDCGQSHRDTDEFIHTGRYQDHSVGPCCSDDYTYVTGRRGDQYYVTTSDAVEVNGDWYHDQYLSDNDIVCLENGDYAHQDDVAFCEFSEEYYLSEDCVEVKDMDGMVAKENAWEDEVTGDWYSNNVDSTTDAEGNTVHPDTLETTED